MNFFKRKFSFTEDEDNGEVSLDEVSSSPHSSFSISKMAEKVSSTISAPTSPVHSSETLVRALERSLQPSSIQPPQQYAHDAKTLLVIDDDLIDWSKYFRSNGVSKIRIEQANFNDIHLECTEHTCIVQITNRQEQSRYVTIDGFYIGIDSSLSSSSSSSIIRSLITSNIQSLNSSHSIISFLYLSDLKKNLKKIKLKDGTTIPFLPSIHYPNFYKFNQTNHFPIVVSIGDVRKGIGKMKVQNGEDLHDIEGIIHKCYPNTQIEVEPFIDIKYDLHVQKIGIEYKSFVRRGISSHWKSNASSAVLEQVKNNEKHIHYIESISHYLGGCKILSINILVAKDGREFVHSCSDKVRYFGESQEEDRRNLCSLLKQMLFPSPIQMNGTSKKSPSSSHSIPREEEKKHWHPPPMESKEGKDITFGEDTMGQLKRTFAGIFGDVSIS